MGKWRVDWVIMGICTAKANQKVYPVNKTRRDSAAATALRKRLLDMKKVDNAPALCLERSLTYRKRLHRLSILTEATDISPNQQ
jgi:hypothetical protein